MLASTAARAYSRRSMAAARRSLTWVHVAAGAAIVALAAAILLAMGREPWCRCESIRLWTGDAWGPENSQQLTDPYTFTHVTHGVLLYGLLRLLAPRLSVATRGVLAVLIESGWEV